jgi:glutamine amidotransferase
MLVIVDYGMGNLRAIQNMLRKLGCEAVISSEPAEVEKASKLILPGIGAFDSGAKNLDRLGLTPVLHSKVAEQATPVLGICLGMHLLTKGSEEGTLPGLGWIDANTVKFHFDGSHDGLKLPHMGWNLINVVREGPLYGELKDRPKFYFAHSFHVVCEKQEQVLALTNYGYDFASSVGRDHIFGVQFHPEKSHRFGMTVLRNFLGF